MKIIRHVTYGFRSEPSLGLSTNDNVAHDTMSCRYRLVSLAWISIHYTLINSRGHPENSFQAEDLHELVELRARQRTFHGAYTRTAIGNLAAALTILRLFDRRFYRSTYTTCTLSTSHQLVQPSRHPLRRPRHTPHDPLISSCTPLRSRLRR